MSWKTHNKVRKQLKLLDTRIQEFIEYVFENAGYLHSIDAAKAATHRIQMVEYVKHLIYRNRKEHPH